MARRTNPLTNTEVKQAKPKDKEYNLADGDGLHLRIKPSGSKLWLFNYTRPFIKKRANISFGSYPAVSLANAREKRKEAHELLAQDIDPKEHRIEVQTQKKGLLENTLKSVAVDWFDIKKNSIKQDYAKDIWRSLEIHVFPALGKYPVSKLTAPIAIDALKKVSSAGNLETARRLTQRLNEIMTFSVNTGLIHANPLSGINAAFEKPKRQHMATIKPDELPEFMQTLNAANLVVVTRALIEFQLHTMTRSNEAAKVCWEEFDLENKLWIIPGSRMKMGREHIIPLTPQVLDILKVLERFRKPFTDFVFPSRYNPKKHVNTETVNKALRRIGYKDRLVAHGFRALASTTLNEKEFNPDVIEASLAHVDKNEVRKAYNRANYLDKRREMMNWWSDHIEMCSVGNMSVASNII
ncbi:integrase domain-containing protein [Thalassotalea sp. SU-HH00458]|uniref:integrase domain-containing protein n=1 Tax=Thalassotalea sp. SU-HH00458 TaxID=3127657 RepID=UPI003365837D